LASNTSVFTIRPVLYQEIPVLTQLGFFALAFARQLRIRVCLSIDACRCSASRQWEVKELEQLLSAARHSYLAYTIALRRTHPHSPKDWVIGGVVALVIWAIADLFPVGDSRIKGLVRC
jgi:Putative DNA-binding domain